MIRLENQLKEAKKNYIISCTYSKFSISGFFQNASTWGLQIDGIHFYEDLVLFILAHPYNAGIYTAAQSEKNRIIAFCESKQRTCRIRHFNTGLPFTFNYSYLSITMLQLLIQQGQKISLESLDKQSTALAEAVACGLTPALKESYDSTLTVTALIKKYKVKLSSQLPYIIDAFALLNNQIEVQDRLWEQLRLAVRLEIDILHCRLNNILPSQEIFYHQNWLKNINTIEWIRKSIPPLKTPSTEMINAIDSSSKWKLLLLQRETDPVTYMNRASVKIIALGRGIRIALFTMSSKRQMPLESYVGYTLYKNEYPAAYGGAWIFGHHALIGLNIFEWCRGGESSLFFNELLRTYHQVFDIRHFEVEPYQYGLDNPEGIQSGAFWFYYRMGFRPVDKKLNKVAGSEFKKMTKNVHYRSSQAILKKFTASNMILQLTDSNPFTVNNAKSSMEHCVNKVFYGNYTNALNTAVNHFFSELDYADRPALSSDQNEILLYFFSRKLRSNKRLQAAILSDRSSDPYSYQKVICSTLAKTSI